MPDDPRPIDPAKLAGIGDADFEAPDLVGSVEGWRAWGVSLKLPPFGTTPKLHSVTYSQYFWNPRQTSIAECTKCGHDVPGENCTCGFYSAKSLDHLRSMAYHDYSMTLEAGKVAVIGQLACWGKVIEGSQGWRSSHAYPVQLFVPFEAWKLAKPLSEGYGVPVKLLNVLDPKARP